MVTWLSAISPDAGDNVVVRGLGLGEEGRKVKAHVVVELECLFWGQRSH